MQRQCRIMRHSAATMPLALALGLLITMALLPSTVKAADGYARTIIINSGQVPSAQTDFPVLVSLSDNTLKTVANAGHVANADGSDIYFTDSSGSTQYAYEIEKYDGSSGTLVAWVKTPSLSNGAVFKMCYGGSGGTSNTSSSVWSNAFRGVWHMAQVSSADSTSNHNQGSADGGVSLSTGRISAAASFDGSSGYITCSNNNSSLNFSNAGRYTWSAWVYTPLPSGKAGGQGIVGKANQGTSAGGYVIFLKNTTNSLTIQDGSATSIGSGPTASGTYASLAANAWYHVAVVYDNGAVSFYIQGAPAGSGSFSTPLTSDSLAEDFQIGFRSNYTNGNGLFQGTIDEVEYSSVTRSAGWIQTQYNNQSNPNAFYTVSAETAGATSSETTYVITTSMGVHGSISPVSPSVSQGADQAFTITPDAGYHVKTLLIDGSAVTPATSYNFTNVTADHSISATFAINASTTSTSTAWTATAAAQTATPIAGAGNTITLTVKNSDESSDTSFSGTKDVTISGYSPARDGSYGTFNRISLTSPPNTISVKFSDGVATPVLILNRAGEQTVSFNIAGLNTPTTNSVSISTKAGPKSALRISRQPTGPVKPGDKFQRQPVVQIVDAHQNMVTGANDTVTATIKDGGKWTLGGTTSTTASSGVATFSGLTATTSSITGVTTAVIIFTSGNLASTSSNTFTVPAATQEAPQPTSPSEPVATTGKGTNSWLIPVIGIVIAVLIGVVAYLFTSRRRAS